MGTVDDLCTWVAAAAAGAVTLVGTVLSNALTLPPPWPWAMQPQRSLSPSSALLLPLDVAGGCGTVAGRQAGRQAEAGRQAGFSIVYRI